jgi:hypothetical protein
MPSADRTTSMTRTGLRAPAHPWDQGAAKPPPPRGRWATGSASGTSQPASTGSPPDSAGHLRAREETARRTHGDGTPRCTGKAATEVDAVGRDRAAPATERKVFRRRESSNAMARAAAHWIRRSAADPGYRPTDDRAEPAGRNRRGPGCRQPNPGRGPSHWIRAPPPRSSSRSAGAASKLPACPPRSRPREATGSRAQTIRSTRQGAAARGGHGRGSIPAPKAPRPFARVPGDSVTRPSAGYYSEKRHIGCVIRGRP